MKHFSIKEILLISFFLFLTLLPSLSIVSLILLVVYFIYKGKLRQAITLIKHETGLQIFIGFYLLHVIGLIYSTNLSYGLSDLQTKLSFLIVPVIFAGLNISEKEFDKIKITFILSSVISLLILLSVSAYQYSYSGDANDFLYTRLSHTTHSTYVSIYLNIAMLFIQERYFKNGNKKYSFGFLIFFLFLFTGLLLLSARTSTIAALISLIAYPFFIFKGNINKQKLAGLHIGIIFCMGILFYSYLNLFNRFNQVKQEIELRKNTTVVDSVTQESPNSTNIRINLWKNAIELIGRNPIFGVGTGDLKEELVKVYTENNYEYGMRERTSPHNQFLHTAVILGLMGVLMLSAYLFFPLYLSFKSRDWLYFIFLCIIILNCMTESLLERQAGILFFTMLNTCFYLRMRSGNRTESL